MPRGLTNAELQEAVNQITSDVCDITGYSFSARYCLRSNEGKDLKGALGSGHRDSWEDFLCNRTESRYREQINDLLKTGKSLQIAVESQSIYGFDRSPSVWIGDETFTYYTESGRQTILPHNNLVASYRAEGCDIAGISPDIPAKVWEEIGLHQGIVQKIPFPDNHFDLVLSLHFFNRLYNDYEKLVKQNPLFRKTAAKEKHRVLKPTGLLALGIFTEDELVKELMDNGFEPLTELRPGKMKLFQPSS